YRDVGADFVVGPAVIAHDGVRSGFRGPALRRLADDLAQTLPASDRTLVKFESPCDVVVVVWPIADRLEVSVVIVILVVGERESRRCRRRGRALLLTSRGADRVD